MFDEMATHTIAASPSVANEFPADTEEDIANIDIEARKDCLKTARHDLCPFKLQWSFGINVEVPVINLTTDNCTLLAYACSHVAIMYDYSSKTISPLQGHQNAVKTLSTTRDAKWLLTADFEEDCVVIIWDTEKRIPVCTLFNPHGTDGITAARISPNAKYIVTVGNEKCQNVHFWLWTYDKDKPNASISLIDTMSERVKEVIFNDEHPEQFALTTDYHILFLVWDDDALSYDCPKATKLRHVGIFNGSCYVSKMQLVFTATTNGCILMWGNVPSEEEHKIDNCSYKKKKKHIKTVNLQKCNITVIIENESMLVMGNSDGRVSFYDYQLRLLYWYENCDLGSIRWISFDFRSYLQATVFTAKPSYPPTDATLQCSLFNVRTFLACSLTGIIVLIDIPKQKCHHMLRHSVIVATSLDTHPEINYVVVGDAQGTVYLYNHEELLLTTSKSTLDFLPILEKQIMSDNIVYVTCPQTHESLKAVTALKFSPRCDMLACGLENGALWILHHITLDLLNEIPYKHSAAAINKITFTQCAEYMAYADNALTVVVFKRNDTVSSNNHSTWNLIGKYHSHYLPIRDILFSPAYVSDPKIPRFFSLGEDQELIEYDLEHSGPYPEPGLKILHIKRIEHTAIPLCLAWYPECDNENFFIISNSEYKYKIFNDVTKLIRGTYLGPTIGKPVQHFQILTDKLIDDKGYIVFATDKEIGLQLLPVDGNPYKIHGMTGHPQKIMNISVSNNKEIMFTIGYNDPCVLMWDINLRSVDITARLGGRGISPFHCLIEGGKKGWLMNEMKDLFHYAQILQQGENTTVVRVITDTVVVDKIPNLMRAIGYYPTNEEIENMMREVCYKYHAGTSKLNEEITFEGFVQLYVNHRPALGLTMDHTKKAFRIFVEERFANAKDPSLTRKQFVDILLGRAISAASSEDQKLISEPLSLQEAYTYLKLLASFDEETTKTDQPSPSQRTTSFDFNFLPSRISYKDFTMDIMGVELPEGEN